MAAVLPTLIRTGAVALGSAIAGIGYAALVERNAFVLREVTMPVLTPGSTPLRVLHISDLHMLPNQHRKQAWLRELASWEPDLVVNTGDNLAHPKAVPAVVQTLSDLLSRPGVFVFGSNDYFGPRLKNPMNYLTSPDPPRPRSSAALAGSAGGVHRTWVARPNPYPPRVRSCRSAHRRCGRRRPAYRPRPLRHHRRPGQPGRQPAAGAHPFTGAAGVGPLRRRWLPVGAGRPHPRRAAVPAVVRGAGH
ncbi:conserved hypothetical protein [Mycobacterium tuberculosis T17]|nr:conserved hypothetical protein [Mycobacterium tuberculosis T17]